MQPSRDFDEIKEDKGAKSKKEQLQQRSRPQRKIVHTKISSYCRGDKKEDNLVGLCNEVRNAVRLGSGFKPNR